MGRAEASPTQVMSIEIFRLYIYMYICIYLPSVIPVFHFNDMQYFFRYAHAHTTSQARVWSEHFNVELEKEGKLCKGVDTGGGALGAEAPPPDFQLYIIIYWEQLLTCIKYWLLLV